MTAWNPLVDGFPEYFREFEHNNLTKGAAEVGIHREGGCRLADRDHDFGMIDSVQVERDTSLVFNLICGCQIVLQDALGGGVIEVRT